MSTQNEALRLAETLVRIAKIDCAMDEMPLEDHSCYKAAAELRRLQAENEELRKQQKADDEYIARLVTRRAERDAVIAKQKGGV